MISGVGELDIEKDTPKKEDAEAKDLPYPDCPFLLLDVRDRDAYDQCHIVGGEEMESYYSWGHTQLCVSCWQARLHISPLRRTSLDCRTSLHSSSTPIPPGKG